jgi:hypothetical protein
LRSYNCFYVSSTIDYKDIQVLEELQFVDLDENIEGCCIRRKEHPDVDRNALTVVEAAGADDDDDELISRVLGTRREH